MAEVPRILVVDAEEDHLGEMIRCLQGVGQIEAATSGEEAWALIQASDPHVVIADQQLPGIHGLELLHRAVQHDPHVGRILLGRYGDTPGNLEAIDRRRAEAYVSKPCLPHQLRLTVHSVLERTRLERDNARLCEDLVTKNGQLREAMRSLRAAQRRVLDSERLGAIGRMIAMIVHDFRGPLAVIRSTAGEIARDDVAAAERDSLAEEILQETERMSRMCAELLEVTRASGGPIHQNETEFDELVATSLALLADDAARAGVTIQSRLGSGARLLLDADRFRRVLLNLGYNALEAMPEGGELRVETRRGEDGVWLSVSDTGHGVPPELAPRIFDPFVTHGKHGGSGLGLAVVKKVVEDHGGTITLAKPEGGGTAFHIHLPAFLVC
jgi:signal transduction histidine kinase